MDVLIFIGVLVLLILVHELGHFIAAKLSGMRVDEFGIGFPPRALTIAKKGDTAYTLNWLPFGGFVKIYGENAETSASEDTRGKAFTDKNRFLQAVVLVAGVAMNFLLAYVLITGALVAGTPRALTPEEIPYAKDKSLAIASVLADSPAATAGLIPGDKIVRAEVGERAWNAVDPESFTEFVAGSEGADITLSVTRADEAHTLIATPEQGVVAADATRYALGVSVATIGTVPLSFGEALLEGVYLTWGATTATAVGLYHFFAGILTLNADLSQVSGPVGIAGAVGDATASGLGNLLALMAIISINLAIINLIPVPALDGGRLLFVLIEAALRRPIAPAIVKAVNGIGFLFLIGLMVVVTFNDVFRLVG